MRAAHEPKVGDHANEASQRLRNPVGLEGLFDLLRGSRICSKEARFDYPR